MIVYIFLCCLGVDLLVQNSVLSYCLDSLAFLSGNEVSFRFFPMVLFLDGDYVFFVFVEGVEEVLLGSDEVVGHLCGFEKTGFLLLDDFYR